MNRLEALNFARDLRNQGPATPPILYLETEDGHVDEIELPTRWAVCPVCSGEGKHINPAIDCGGLSREDFDEDPDFAEAYMAGVYDVPCNHCGGRTTVREVDLTALSPEQRQAWQQQLRDEAEYRALELAELRAGA